MALPSVSTLTSRLERLSSAGLSTDAYCLTVCDEIRQWVPFDFGCAATTDPTTGLITGAVKTADTGLGDEEFAYYEYAVDDVNQFAEVAGRPEPVGVLSVDTAGRPDSSVRFRSFLAPRFGFTDELRLAFRSHGLTWGVIGIYRADGACFRPGEARLALAFSKPVAIGMRRSLFREAVYAGAAPGGPAVIVVGPDDQISRISDAGTHRVEEMGGLDHGSLPPNLLALLNTARRGGFPSIRVRTGQGWLVARAAALGTGDGGTGADVAVTLDIAGPGELTPLALAAFGLTAREDEVARLVLQGTSTPAIAAGLFLSPHTVQDHLKNIFAKVGVSSRRELIAKVFFGHHASRMASRRRTDGSLSPTS